MKHKWLGWLACVVCVAMLFIWIPLDVDSGIIEKLRRQVTLGDAFAPSVAAIIIGLGGLLILLEREPTPTDSDRNANTDSSEPATGVPDAPGLADIKHAFVILIIVTASLFLMRYSGPLLLHFIEGEAAEYRLLRDTVPWKYAGFIAGGVFMIVSLIALTEKRLRWQHIMIALISVAVLIAFYDLPFEDLLLPPNGDV